MQGRKYISWGKIFHEEHGLQGCLNTYFQPMFHFYTPKDQKTVDFMFSGDVEVEYWLKVG